MSHQIKLQLTNNYHLVFEQITRIVQYSAAQGRRKKIPRAEFLAALGMVERHFENVSSLSVALGLLNKQTLVLTTFGQTLAQHDLFFDQVEMLWLLHYVIASEPKWVVWNRLVNRIFPQERVLSPKIARPYYADLAAQFSAKTIATKLPQEIAAALNAYTEQKFARLHLLEIAANGDLVRREPVAVQPLPFLYMLLHFRDSHFPNATGLMIDEVRRAENSPGRVCCVNGDMVQELLNALHDLKLLRLETFGDLAQIRFADGVTKSAVLKKMYGT